MPRNRRQLLKVAGTIGLTGAAGCLGGGGGGTPDEVTIGTLTPLSGPFARDGQLVKQGVEFAAEQINSNGGIEALDGAEINVAAKDTGASTSSATSAAQSLYSAENPSATIGSWQSSQTLATSSVSEREQVPQLTLSYSDKLVNRDFKNIFQTSPKASQFGKQSLDLALNLAKEQGTPIEKVALVGDNTAAVSFTFKPLRDKYIPQAEGVSTVVDKVWTPTLSDATPIVRALEENEPDLMFFGASAFSDSLAILRKMNERNISIPTIGIGAWLTIPAYIENIGAELTKGMMAVTGSHPLKGQQDTIKKFTEFADEPFMIQDSLSGYAHTYLAKAAMEKAGSADPKKVRDTLSNTTFTEGPGVKSFPVDKVDFNSNGHMKNAQAVLTQWQDKSDAEYIGTPAAPFTAFPSDVNLRKPKWTPAKYS